MPKKGNKRKKTRTHEAGQAPEGAVSMSKEFHAQKDVDNVPRSIVAKTSKVAPMVSHLVKDLRKMMGPYTASHLKEKSYNRMKDFAGMATHLGVTHLLMLSQTERNIVLRIAKSITGPTIHFRVKEYTLARQVKSMQKRPAENAAAFSSPPLVVLNNFGSAEANEGSQHVRLMRIMLQNMLPAIDVKTVRLRECRRVVLFNYRKEDGTVELRHYAIKAQPVGISKSVKRIIRNQIPNLGGLKDISDFVEGGMMGEGAASDSEAEDVGARVELAEKYRGRGNGATQQSAMKLTEIGPRLTLELFKCERGVGEGDILYHKFQTKSAEDSAATKARIDQAAALKDGRRKEQEQNVVRKAAEADAAKAAKVARRDAREAAKADKFGNKRSRDDGDDDESDCEEEEAVEGESEEDEDEEEEEEEEEVEEESDDEGVEYSDVDDGEESEEE